MNAVKMRALMLLVLLYNYSGGAVKPPNVCKKFTDYITMDPNNCWHNPDVYEDAPKIIKRRGYPLETYEVETEDGYLLTMYRIPRNDSKKIVYFQHPATATCVGWIDKGESSPAFIFWNAGYDVWLGNFRGNYYSRKHKRLDPNEFTYWNFSFHEMGLYDIKSQLDMIVNVTEAEPQSVSFFGYSMSSSSALIYASLLPDHAQKWFNIMVLMAPTSFLGNVDDYIKFASQPDGIEKMANQFKFGEFAAHNAFFTSFQSICRSGPLMFLCIIYILSTFGNVPEELIPEWYPIMHYQVPGGLSLKCYLHYMQLASSDNKFQYYDYGPDKNLEYYHSATPPGYPLQNISTPIYLMNAGYDPLVTPKDVAYLYSVLPEKVKIYGRKEFKRFGHASFFYGKHMVDWVYRPMLKLVDSIHESRKNQIE